MKYSLTPQRNNCTFTCISNSEKKLPQGSKFIHNMARLDNRGLRFFSNTLSSNWYKLNDSAF